MTWQEGPLAGFDTETTGVDPFRDRIVTAAIVVRGAQDEPVTRNWLINPGVPIPQGAQAVHGISTAHAEENGADPAEALEEIATALLDCLTAGNPVVAFNASYDLTLLEAELARHDLKTLSQRLGHAIRPVIDPLVLDRAIDRYRKGKRTLTALCEHYKVTPESALHAADVDVMATLKVLDAQIAQNPELLRLDLEQLHDWQAAAHQSWAASFNAYRASRGLVADVPLTWPL